MSNEANNKQAKLILQIESGDGKTVERVIEGTTEITFVLGEAGILDKEIMALLGCS